MENTMIFFSPAENFEEALPVGNGSMGAMIYGRTDREKISFNHESLWSGTGEKNFVPENAPETYRKIQKYTLENKFYEARELVTDFISDNTAHYLPFGNLFIDLNHKNASDYSRILHLDTGIVSTAYNVNGVHHSREVFASYDHCCVAIKITSDKKSDFDISFEHKLKITSTETRDNTVIYNGVCPVIVDGVNEYNYPEGGKTVSFSHQIKVISDGNVSSDKISVTGATQSVIFVCINSSTEKLINYDKIKADHIKDFSSLYGRTSLTLTDKKDERPLDIRIKEFDGTDFGLYELLFGFGRYLLISSSRKKALAANLQGIWNEEKFAPWRSNYTLNINTQMNYWPAFCANLGDCFEPFINLLEKIRQTGRETAKDFYGAKGFVCHHNTDMFGHANPVGKDLENNYIYAFWNMSAGWMASQLFDEYEYTLDKEMLKNTIYPIMKESAEFYLDILYKDENGKYMICPSTSPENIFLVDGETYSISKTTTMTCYILYDLFSKLIRAAEVLEIDNDFRDTLKHITENLYFPEILADGSMPEWSEDYAEYDVHHRHVSHLYGLYPADIISPDKTPTLAKACEKSLIGRGDGGTGWSLAWKINLWARLGDGNHAIRLLDRQLKYVDPSAPLDYSDGGGSYPNLFCAHPPFQIDGNLGVVSGLTEMFMHSRMGYIEILPALPDKLSKGEICGIKAKGNITVDICWENGNAKKVTLVSPVSQTVTVSVNGKTVNTCLIKNTKRDVI